MKNFIAEAKKVAEELDRASLELEETASKIRALAEMSHLDILIHTESYMDAARIEVEHLPVEEIEYTNLH